jgi:hypothetical protein
VDLSDGEAVIECTLRNITINANFDVAVKILPIILPVFAKKGESGNRIHGSSEASLREY